MKTSQHNTIVGVFQTRGEADTAVAQLRREGFGDDQIGVVGRNEQGETTTTHVGVGAVAGVIAGGSVGGLVGLGVLAGVIPVIGPAIAAGTLGTILLNAAGGAAIAGLVGALVGMGIPEDEAKYYEGELQAGRYLVTVQADTEVRRNAAWKILHGYGAYNRQHQRASVSTATGVQGSSPSTTEGQTLQVHEEELHVQKQPVETGEVRVRKEVVTDQKTLHVPVQREEVVIERHPVAGARASSSDVRPGEEIRIPVKEEQVRVEKETVVKEEVHVGKRKVQDTETVSGTVRKEQVRVEQEGNVDVRSSGVDQKNKDNSSHKG